MLGWEGAWGVPGGCKPGMCLGGGLPGGKSKKTGDGDAASCIMMLKLHDASWCTIVHQCYHRDHSETLQGALKDLHPGEFGGRPGARFGAILGGFW